MKTEQEQIDKMARTMCGFCSTDGKCAVSRNLREPEICADVDTYNCLFKEHAEQLVENGFGDVSEYKAEIRELKADLDHQIDATNDAENLASHLQYDYDKCFKRLKSMQKELNELKDKLKSVAYVEPIKDVVIIKRSDFDNLMEESKQ